MLFVSSGIHPTNPLVWHVRALQADQGRAAALAGARPLPGSVPEGCLSVLKGRLRVLGLLTPLAPIHRGGVREALRAGGKGSSHPAGQGAAGTGSGARSWCECLPPSLSALSFHLKPPFFKGVVQSNLCRTMAKLLCFSFII